MIAEERKFQHSKPPKYPNKNHHTQSNYQFFVKLAKIGGGRFAVFAGRLARVDGILVYTL